MNSWRGATTPLPPTCTMPAGPTIWRSTSPEAGLPIRTVLDLACGTGSLTRVLAERGYEMIGADLSQEMLAQAAEKCRGAGPIEPILSASGHGGAGSLRHYRRLRVLPGQHQLRHQLQKAGPGLPAGAHLPHARRPLSL